MLDLSQFETDLPPIRDGYTYNLVHGLIAECRRLQENNRELCEYMKNELRDYVNDAWNAHVNEYGTNYRSERITYFKNEIEKIDALIAKNQGA